MSIKSKSLFLFFVTGAMIALIKSDRNDDLPNGIATETTVGEYCQFLPVLPNTTPKFMPFVGTCTAENNEVCKEVVEYDAATNQNFIKVLCQCGYRNESNDQRLLHLAPNTEQICLGIPGFPCKSHPLEDDKFNESCISGYCDLTLNQCATEVFVLDVDSNFTSRLASSYGMTLGLLLFWAVFKS